MMEYFYVDQLRAGRLLSSFMLNGDNARCYLPLSELASIGNILNARINGGNAT